MIFTYVVVIVSIALFAVAGALASVSVERDHEGNYFVDPKSYAYRLHSLVWGQPASLCSYFGQVAFCFWLAAVFCLAVTVLAIAMTAPVWTLLIDHANGRTLATIGGFMDILIGVAYLIHAYKKRKKEAFQARLSKWSADNPHKGYYEMPECVPQRTKVSLMWTMLKTKYCPMLTVKS